MEILLNPGPVNLSERVRAAMLKPDLCHREIEFSNLQRDIRKGLLEVYDLDPETWTAVLLTGSGTAAMEAMMTGMIPESGRVLIVENGVYGERLSRIAQIHNINFRAVHHDWTGEINIDALSEALTPDITHVALIHHETTTGRLNDIAPIADVCRSRNIPLLLDGVSSFGAEAIQFEDWHIGACAGAANKCLHGIPGVSFVIVRRSMLPDGNLQRTLYLDLNSYLKLQDDGGTPFTQSVQCFYALDEALNEHRDEGGWMERRACYRTRMKRVVDGLKQLGIRPLIPDGSSSCVLTAFHLPPGMDYQSLHDRLREKGFVIYAGQGEFARTLFRISLMGAISGEDIGRLLEAFTSILRE